MADRAGNYDQAGVFRDMVQNHLLQLPAVVAMELPSNFQSASEIVAPAQYDGYLAEPNVPSNSRTPTYAAVRMDVENWSWQGVSFFLRSGKALEDKCTEIMIQFRRPPHLMFDQGISPDILAIQAQRDWGLHLEFQAKTPDERMGLKPVDLEFQYDDSFGSQAVPDAYEHLLLDATNGDASLFTGSDEIEEAWETMDPVIQGLAHPDALLAASYAIGSRGPAEADGSLAEYGCDWQHRTWQH